MTRKRILITGASGFMGSNFVLEACPIFDVFAIANTNPVPISGIDCRSVDLGQKTQVHRLFAEIKPEVVIHCAAATAIDNLEDDPITAYYCNRDMAEHVASASAEVGSYLIHISTDSVFDGTAGPYNEDDISNPINVYASSKLAGEQAVLEENPNAAIIRTNIFGWSIASASTLAEWFLNELGRGHTPAGFTDVFFSPLLVNSLFQILVQFMDHRISGLFHVPGANCISKYEFGRLLAVRFDFDPVLIQPSYIDESIFRANRPKQTCLDGSKVCAALGIQLPQLDDDLGRLKDLLLVDVYRNRRL